jgi:hypothetical protein
MRVALTIRLEVCHMAVVDVHRHPRAVGQDQPQTGTSVVAVVAPGPEEGRLEDDLLGGITLRAVDRRGGLGHPEHVRDPVVAHAVARTELRMGVVVERAPAEAAGDAWIGVDGVQDRRVQQGVVLGALDVVVPLGRERAANSETR